MTLSMAEFQAFGKRPVLSPEETVAAEAYYQQRSQFHGMSGLGACCSSCEKPGMGGFSAPVFPGRGRGMGAVPVTVLWGAGERDAQDLRSSGAGFTSSVDPGAVNASLARPRDVSLDRRVALTRMIEELEALTGTPGVSPEVLAQRVWTARLALLSAGNWSWADYADPREAHDAKIDLERRLLVVERLLGVGKLAPALGALALRDQYGLPSMTSISGLGAGGGAWGQAYNDPVEKLASCIRGALCMPKAFCCPSRRQPAAPSRLAFRPAEVVSNSILVDEDEILEGDGIEERRLIDDTWLPPPGGLPKLRRVGEELKPGGAGEELRPAASVGEKLAPESSGTIPLPGGIVSTGQRAVTSGGTGQSAPATAVAAPGGMPLFYPISSGMIAPTPPTDPFAAEKARRVAMLRASASGGGSGQALRAGHSLGSLPLASAPAINMLRMKLRQARNEIARRRA